MPFKKGDTVLLPFDEKGKIVKVRENQLWGCKYDVKITEATLSTVGEIADFKEEQLMLPSIDISDIRNKLTPIKNLIAMLESSDLMYHHNPKVHKLINRKSKNANKV